MASFGFCVGKYYLIILEGRLRDFLMAFGSVANATKPNSIQSKSPETAHLERVIGGFLHIGTPDNSLQWLHSVFAFANII